MQAFLFFVFCYFLIFLLIFFFSSNSFFFFSIFFYFFLLYTLFTIFLRFFINFFIFFLSFLSFRLQCQFARTVTRLPLLWHSPHRWHFVDTLEATRPRSCDIAALVLTNCHRASILDVLAVRLDYIRQSLADTVR